MERWENPRCHGRDTLTTASTSNYHRSFSSSLLDAIYRSIDEGAGTGGGRREGNDTVATGKQLSHAVVEERKKSTTSTQKPVLSRRGPDAMNDQPQQHQKRTQQHQRQQRQRDRFFANTTSSSSESSYGGFSSSDAEKPVAISAIPRPKPIRTSAPPETRKEKRVPRESNEQKTEGSIGERFRASKLYRELKKAKAPVSPGARLASFLNTLFAAAGSTKKAKAANVAHSDDSRAAGDASLCYSASSYSRSRLSRTPSSMGNMASGCGGDGRRSVRFFPVSFIVDEDCRPRGHRCPHADQKAEYFRRCGPPEAPDAAERKPAREATREFIRGYEEKKRGEEEEEDDGAGSYSSSDLFELENLAAIGAGGELPVYETTRLEANRTIAQGLGVQKKSN